MYFVNFILFLFNFIYLFAFELFSFKKNLKHLIVIQFKVNFTFLIENWINCVLRWQSNREFGSQII